MGSIPVDIAGERFGHLVAIKPTGNSIKGRGREWECKCDCGNLFYATPTQLRAGNNVSCGCLIPQGQKAIRYEPLQDCVSCMRSEDDYKCNCLTEMFCVTRGKCKFYTPKLKGGAENG